ncbi:MAG: succinylglutamate desuccinylase/aspartoacylase family protein [Chromatiales bacterium]|nr:MAG: succinylglutamate desuccinylase/aspartoacylase family protein [Chromatiales bacterium]
MKKSDDILLIGDTTIRPGERVNVDLPVADLYTSTSLSMPVKVIRGRQAGPVLFVSAAIHGDELNGVEIIRRLLKLKALRSIRGTLIAIPVVNVHGFLDQSRYLPDRRDLNRSFPGSAKGSIAARLANLFLKEIVAKADAGVDLHTGAVHRSNLPQIRANLDDPGTLEIATAFAAPVVINSNTRDGSLRACAAKRGMPILIYEAGEALRFDETGIKTGLRGVLNVMRNMQMLPAARGKSRVKPVIARSTRWIRAGASGIVSGKVKLGSTVSKGETIAMISDPLGNEEYRVIAPIDGIVIGRTNLPLAHEGDALFNLGTFRNMPKASNAVQSLASADSTSKVS